MRWENNGTSEIPRQQKVRDAQKPKPGHETQKKYLASKPMCNICQKKAFYINIKAHMRYNHDGYKSEKRKSRQEKTGRKAFFKNLPIPTLSDNTHLVIQTTYCTLKVILFCHGYQPIVSPVFPVTLSAVC